jgi:hypothetical protein
MGGVPMVVEGEFSPEEVRRDKVIAALSYLPLLVLIPIFACVDSQFARRHANQGVLLLLAHFVIWLFYLALYVGIVEDYDTVVTVSVIWVMVESGVMALVLRQIFACLRGEFVAFPLLGKLNLLD